MWHDGFVTPATAQGSRVAGARERARAEITREIMDTARRHLSTDGAAGLSLRAVARDLGMVSSALYRYVPSRDDLLTRLIVSAYDSMGAAAEAAEHAVPREDLDGRFRAVARAVRRWAVEHEHEYALIYGSPVPGYRAPETTIPSATRVPALLIRIIRDGLASGRLHPDGRVVPPEALATMSPALEAFAAQDGSPPPPDLVVRALMSWTYLFGAVSFDLFGHRHNVIVDERAAEHPFFEHELDRLVELIGLGPDAKALTDRPLAEAGISRAGR